MKLALGAFLAFILLIRTDLGLAKILCPMAGVILLVRRATWTIGQGNLTCTDSLPQYSDMKPSSAAA